MKRLRAEGIAHQEVEGEIVVLDLQTSRYLSINSAGTVLWPLLTQGAATDELIGHLVDTFGIDREHAERDVTAFLSELEQRGLLESE